jgi:Spx/MgsR family transcriptional regulator
LIQLYGIPNCNTVKNARLWLQTRGVVFEFHDFKRDGVSAELLADWLRQYPWEKLVNRAGLTWRGLPDTTKSSVSNHDEAIALMLRKPSVIKRPVLVQNRKIIRLGFDETIYETYFPT